MTQGLLRVDQVAERLKLSPMTIYAWIRQHRLPAVKLGRRVRIREEDLEALIRFGSSPLSRRKPR